MSHHREEWFENERKGIKNTSIPPVNPLTIREDPVLIIVRSVKKMISRLLMMTRDNTSYNPLFKNARDISALISLRSTWKRYKDGHGNIHFRNIYTKIRKNTSDMPKVPDSDDYPDVTKYTAASDDLIWSQGQNIIAKMQELIKACNEDDYKFPYGILSETVTKSRKLFEFYLTWELRMDKTTNVKSYFNRHTKKSQSEYPLPNGWIKEGKLWKDKEGRYHIKQPSHYTTSSEVQFLLQMAAVIDAQDVLHSMRLLLYA
jgi:hypothetical protein